MEIDAGAGWGGRATSTRGARAGEHCYENRKSYSCCCGMFTLVFIIVMSISWGTIAPTEYGLLRNGITGVVDMNTVYPNGRYFVGPTQNFIVFPRIYKTLSYGNRSTDEQSEIRARTGADTSDESSSGGQPVGLSISFQYQLTQNKVPRVYETFGTRWEVTYLRLAQQAITNVAQDFTPRAFWTRRSVVQRAMLTAVNNTLAANGYAVVRALQLRAVSFQSSYEQTIINIQLQEQLRVTKSYQLEVTRVSKMVDLLQSETDAEVVAINAQAAREKAIIEGEANAAALQREQDARATMYARIRAHLGWTADQFLQYIKMKALNAQPQSNVVVGVNPLGSVASSDPTS